MIEEILAGFAAIDIGQEQIFVATACGDAATHQPVRSFGTHTADYRDAARYLRQQGVRRVAMEATGVYWIPLHDLLQAQGLEVTVFHGAHARNLPGRKTDVKDCQWHAMLHSHGLLSPCFIPPDSIRRLRAYYRLREDHLSIAASHLQHMQRALDLMNVRLHVVISQIQGVSGMRVIKAILEGERNPLRLLALCDPQIRNKKSAEVLKSLEGDWQAHHLFALRQAVECYEFYQQKMAQCDEQIELLLKELNANRPLCPPCAAKPKTARHNAPQVEDLHTQLITLQNGRDATVLPGISPLGMLKLTSELGTDLSGWKSEKHFTSWLGLSPGNNRSGKRRRRCPRRKTKAGQIFREAVPSLAKSRYLALGVVYRKLKARRGAAIAATAVARKLAVLYYRLHTKGLQYVERGVADYEERVRQQTIRYLNKVARRHGLAMTATPVPVTA